MIELLFDANDESLQLIEKNILPDYPSATFEKIDTLPQWVKSFLLRGYRPE